ncbi:MAG: NAD(P)/FAD-dependent oxidoreductase [Burkholderiaceae bacterium]
MTNIRSPENERMVDAFQSPDDILQHADLRILLMSLVHITGDLSWLEPPFRPKRDIRLVPDPGAGLSSEARHAILSKASQLIEQGFGEPAIKDPGDALMQRMMNVTLGEEVAPEYSAMMREELGFISRAYPAGKSEEDRVKETVVIVGAGVSGIALAVRLKELGIPFVIIEQTDRPGGVWHRNRYPGCGVDTPNHSYSYSFGPRYPWTRYFSRREEILDYIDNVVRAYDLLPHIRLNTKVSSASWKEQTQEWHIDVTGPEGATTEVSRFFVSAIGQLSDPMLPRIEGMDRFQGLSFHSMSWPEGLDIAGKRVAIIGTGATAMQLVPTVRRQALQVDVYQRSAQWVRPIEGYADPIKPGAQWLQQHMPYYAEWFRFNMFWRYGDGLLACLQRDPNWPHSDRSVNSTNERHRVEMVEFIKSKLHDRPDLLEKCVPDYPPYGKRILLDNNWYDTLKQPNVALITERIDRISETGVVCADGSERPADIIVYATGFKLTEMAARLNVHGMHGKTLADAWADDDPKAYLGVTVSGFPNFFTLIGPNSGPAHGGSVIFQAECQVRYITGCILQMRQQGVGCIDIREDVLARHVHDVDAEHEKLVWSHPAVSTYYRNAKGRVFSVIPWRFVDYWAMTHEPDLAVYETRPLSSPETRLSFT